MLGKPSRHLKKHLEEHGKKATAVVVEIASKGMAVTNGAEGVIGNTTLDAQDEAARRAERRAVVRDREALPLRAARGAVGRDEGRRRLRPRRPRQDHARRDRPARLRQQRR